MLKKVGIVTAGAVALSLVAAPAFAATTTVTAPQDTPAVTSPVDLPVLPIDLTTLFGPEWWKNPVAVATRGGALIGLATGLLTKGATDLVSGAAGSLTTPTLPLHISLP